MPTLSWLTREKDVKRADGVAYRLLERDAGLSVGDAASGNMLIQGDNLEALKSLLPYYSGAVKCIYIDPPYNTRSAFEHYDDNLEHSQWLAMIWPRLVLLRELLAEDGSIWVSIDDNEGHYLKVIMDEVFGRKNFIGNVIWQKKYSPQNDAEFFSAMHDHVHVYAKSAVSWNRNLMPRSAKQDAAYKNLDNDPRGIWKTSDLTRAEHRDRDFYGIVTPSGKEVFPARGRSWSRPPAEIERLRQDNRLWFGKKNDAIPSLKRFLTEVKDGVVPQTIWFRDEVGDNQDAKKEVKAINADEIFGTPKPERLLERILHIATNPGDLVLDSFLGSGTTAAVAHKMGRRWIGIEMGDHAVTHCAPRIQKVIDGEQGGISQSVGWQSGGGFAFYRLGAAVFDGDGAINPGIAFAPLAAHVWFSETGAPYHFPPSPSGEEPRVGAVRQDQPSTDTPHPNPSPKEEGLKSPFLGHHDGRGLALLYNGILGDKRVSGGNVLTRKTLALIRAAAGSFAGPITVYGEASRLSPETLKAEGITFKQTPYDVRAR